MLTTGATGLGNGAEGINPASPFPGIPEIDPREVTAACTEGEVSALITALDERVGGVSAGSAASCDVFVVLEGRSAVETAGEWE